VKESGSLLGPLIAPRSVAVLGASPREGGHAGRLVANLDRTGYAGQVFPVNPKYEQIGQHRCYPSILDVEEPVDAAYLLVPAARVVEAVRQCAQVGVPVVVVCTSGFAELGDEGRKQQERLLDAARASGTRLLGPNCIGVLNVVDRFVGCPTFNLTEDFTPGVISVLSHSGGMGTVIVNRAQARRIGVRAMVSLGNEADLEMAELVDALIDDPATRCLCLFVEQLRDGPLFVAAAERARAAGVPIVVLKSGRSEPGARTVLGHTGALAGDAAVFSAVLRELGAVEVRGIEEMLDAALLLTQCPAPAGPRLGAVSPSGGETGYVADWASDRGLVLPALQPETEQTLRTLMRFGTPGNPLDPTGAVIGDRELLRRMLDVFFADVGFDLVHIAIPAWGSYDAVALLPTFVDAARTAAKPAVISGWSAGRLTEAADELLLTSGVPVLPSSDRAVVALAHLHDYWHRRLALRADAPSPLSLAPPADEPTEYDAKRWLASEAGIDVAREVVVAQPENVVRAARQLRRPVVLKLLARGVVHKSDLGLVELDLRTDEELRVAADRLAGRAEQLDLDVEGYLVAEQASGLEVLVGGVQDLTFGPIVAVGAGGLLTEYLADTAFLQCPASEEHVRAALEQLSLHRVLTGARGRRYDVDALEALVSRISRVLAGAPWLTELDLNPVVVRERGRGCVVVDAMLRVTRPADPADPLEARSLAAPG
jgi:acetate---CoA ligase (ADP-forming)